MAMPPRERQYITNWQMSIIAAARVHDMEFIRCLRLISQVMMPSTAPPINLADHAKQDDYSDEDKQALVIWIKVLEDMADTGDSLLCHQFREACNEVFASQGLPDMMVNGPWVKPPPLSGGVEGPGMLRERITQIPQGLFDGPVASSHGRGPMRTRKRTREQQGGQPDPKSWRLTAQPACRGPSGKP